MTESEALIRGVATMEQGGFYDFPASRVRGVHPDKFTARDIANMNTDELCDYMMNLRILDMARFTLGVSLREA